MDDTLILFVAIGVFTLMLIGLGLTIREFRTNIIVTPERKPADPEQNDAAQPRRPQLRRVV